MNNDNIIEVINRKYNIPEDALNRLIRLMSVIVVGLLLVFGSFFLYLILSYQNIAYIASLLFASILLFLSVGIVFFILFSPIVTYIWRGKAVFWGWEDEFDYLTPTLIFGVICFMIGIYLFYINGVFVNQVDYFINMFNFINN